MKFLIISGNPKKGGLCHDVMSEVIRGAEDGGANIEVLELSGIERCHVCGDGWGKCIKEQRCAFGSDGFDAAQDSIRMADVICLITPVYWGETSEGLKCFLDRLRRCAFKGVGVIRDKPVLMVASAGGTGNGILTCLEQMDRFCRHTGAVIFDYIGVNRWNHDYKKAAAYQAAKALAQGQKAE